MADLGCLCLGMPSCTAGALLRSSFGGFSRFLKRVSTRKSGAKIFLSFPFLLAKKVKARFFIIFVVSSFVPCVCFGFLSLSESGSFSGTESRRDEMNERATKLQP